jgi:pilus assembly protein CpaB
MTMAITASRNRVLPLALGLATATTYATYRFLRIARPFGPVPSAAATSVPVVVPVADVAARRPLRASMFAIRSFPADSVPKDSVKSLAELEGKVSRTTLHARQPIARADALTRSAELGLAFAVKPPRRAVTVKLDPIIGVNGFPKPGDHVDVLASFDNTPAGTVTRTVLQDLEILAYGSEVQPPPQAASDKPAGGGSAKEGKLPPASTSNTEAPVVTTATLSVLPAEAERLILAESRGRLRLALRAVDDTSHGKPAGVNEVQLTGVPVNRKEPAATIAASRPAGDHENRPKGKTTVVPAPHRILVVRGGEREVIQVSRLSPGVSQPGSTNPPAVTRHPTSVAAVESPESRPAADASAAQPTAAAPPAPQVAPAVREMAVQPTNGGGLR